MDIPLPWERLLWRRRDLLRPWEWYALTDFRLVREAGANSDEIALQDIGDVTRHQSWLDRLLGTSTITVRARNGRRAPFVMRSVRKGVQLAALLDLAAADPRASWDREFVRAALRWEPRVGHGYRDALLGLAFIGPAVFAVAIGLHGTAEMVSYPADDALAPSGVKKRQADIVHFMEAEVMPWARVSLGPLKGGPDTITCETCHGSAPATRNWQMPAVAALPMPDVQFRGWEMWSGRMDAQMRNAIYGYVAESDNQTRAAYMREIVMPGMARLLHRPAYDFTKSYEYNRTRVAFGCYHCHRVV